MANGAATLLVVAVESGRLDMVPGFVADIEECMAEAGGTLPAFAFRALQSGREIVARFGAVRQAR